LNGALVPLAVILIAAIGLLLLFQSTKPSVEVLGSQSPLVPPTRNADYSQTAAQLLNSSLLNHVKPFTNTKAVSVGLQNKYPEIGLATVTTSFFGMQPKVYIEPAHPAFVLAASNGSFVIDTTGRVVADGSVASRLPASVAPVITDQSNYKAQINRYGLSSKNVSFIRTVLAQMSAKQVRYSSLVLPASSSELDVHIVGQPYFIKFNLQSSTAREQVGTYLATRQELSRQHITPAQYIDVRVEGRAYYQ
jgi:hypothetical protein